MRGPKNKNHEILTTAGAARPSVIVQRPDGTEFETRVLTRDVAGGVLLTSFGTFVEDRWIVHSEFRIKRQAIQNFR